MEIDKTVLETVIKGVKIGRQGSKQINVYSLYSITLLRYLGLVTPKFSVAGAAHQIISEQVMEKYPELLAEIEEYNLPKYRGRRAVLPKTFPEIDHTLWLEAHEITKSCGGGMPIYDPILSVVFRYNSLLTGINMSLTGARMMDDGLKAKYPDVWSIQSSTGWKGGWHRRTPKGTPDIANIMRRLKPRGKPN